MRILSIPRLRLCDHRVAIVIDITAIDPPPWVLAVGRTELPTGKQVIGQVTGTGAKVDAISAAVQPIVLDVRCAGLKQQDPRRRDRPGPEDVVRHIVVLDLSRRAAADLDPVLRDYHRRAEALYEVVLDVGARAAVVDRDAVLLVVVDLVVPDRR